MHCKLRTAGVDAGLHIFEAMPPAGFGGAPKDLELSGGPARLCRVTDLDLILLYGRNRRATVQIAEWTRSLMLDVDTRPSGIVYRSRHAGRDVHAYSLRAVDQGSPDGQEPVTADPGADRRDRSGSGGDSRRYRLTIGRPGGRSRLLWCNSSRSRRHVHEAAAGPEPASALAQSKAGVPGFGRLRRRLVRASPAGCRAVDRTGPRGRWERRSGRSI